MYESIKGILKEKDPLKAVVETNGIGYRLIIPLNTYARLPSLETPVHLHLSQVIREDLHALYAFWTKEERDLFEVLITFSGIGPKTAVAIIGHMEINAFQRAIAAADVRILSKIPGIGKKTAERLVIEMRDKLKGLNKKGKGTLMPPSSSDGILSDALHALLNLGYHPMQAEQALQAVLQEKKDETDLGRLITAALQKI